ncbi:MAG: hypothetical protein HYX24_06930 [Candidatus Aenigmarchaeota archaeon]|nr:hypothetical protein [Candidatus Aenigmarchaeota archaeon]
MILVLILVLAMVSGCIRVSDSPVSNGSSENGPNAQVGDATPSITVNQTEDVVVPALAYSLEHLKSAYNVTHLGWNSHREIPDLIVGNLSNPSDRALTEIAFEFLEKYRHAYRMKDPHSELVAVGDYAYQEESVYRSVVLSRRFQGVIIPDSYIRFLIYRNGVIHEVSAVNYIPNFPNQSIIAPEEAVANAQATFLHESQMTSNIDRVWVKVDWRAGTPQLVYWIFLYNETLSERYYFNAETGEIRTLYAEDTGTVSGDI